MSGIVAETYTNAHSICGYCAYSITGTPILRNEKIYFFTKRVLSQRHTYVLDNSCTGSAISKPWHALIFKCGQVESVFLTELSWYWDLIHTGVSRGVVTRVVWGQNSALWTSRPASTWSCKKQIKCECMCIYMAKTQANIKLYAINTILKVKWIYCLFYRTI